MAARRAARGRAAGREGGAGEAPAAPPPPRRPPPRPEGRGRAPRPRAPAPPARPRPAPGGADEPLRASPRRPQGRHGRGLHGGGRHAPLGGGEAGDGAGQPAEVPRGRGGRAGRGRRRGPEQSWESPSGVPCRPQGLEGRWRLRQHWPLSPLFKDSKTHCCTVRLCRCLHRQPVGTPTCRLQSSSGLAFFQAPPRRAQSRRALARPLHDTKIEKSGRSLQVWLLSLGRGLDAQHPSLPAWVPGTNSVSRSVIS